LVKFSGFPLPCRKEFLRDWFFERVRRWSRS
jgi:hypothetical protein